MGYFSVIRQLECVANSRYVTEVVCNAVPPRNRSINAALRLMQRITGLIGNLEVSIPIPRKKKLKKIFDITFELCKVLRERKRKTLIELLSAMTCLGNRTIQCPIHAVGKNHSMKFKLATYLIACLSPDRAFIVRRTSRSLSLCHRFSPNPIFIYVLIGFYRRLPRY